MRIGLDARYVYASHVHGIGRYSVELIRHLAPLASARGHELIVFRRGGEGEPLVRDSAVREVATELSPMSPAGFVRLGRTARRERLDVFHALFPALPVAPAPRTVVTAHDLQALRVRGFHGLRSWPLRLASRTLYALAYRWSFGAADRIVAGSRWTRDDVAAAYRLPEDRFRVVYEGLSEDFFAAGDRDADAKRIAAAGLDPERRFLLHVGNTRPQKNVEGLLLVFHEMVLREPEGDRPLLVIAGVRDRFFAGVRDRTLALGLGERVRFLTNVSEETLRALYRRAALYVTAARFEGFGFTPLEAMAARCPVAAAAAGALPEILGDGYLAFDPDSPAQAACAILDRLGDPGALATLARLGHERSRTFRWSETARATLAAYEELG